MKNSPWKRDELILALELYFKEPDSRSNEKHSSVIKLSEFLNSLAVNSEEKASGGTFRNGNGVGMKLRNFLSYDPSYEGKALSRGSKLEKEVWEEYRSNVEELYKVAGAIKNNANSEELLAVTDLKSYMVEEAREGAILSRIHIARERSKKIVSIKKRAVLTQTGSLACEACGFDFKKTYGDIGDGFAECHHVKPVSELRSGDVTKLDDLIMLCSNCHRMIHRTRPWRTVSELKAILKTSTSN